MNLFLLKRQIRASLTSARFVVVLLAALVLIGVQYVTTYFASFNLTQSAPTFLRDVMLFSPDGTGSGLYSMVLPFLAALLGGSVVAIEKHSGRLKNLLVRQGRDTTIRTSLLAGFMLGGIGGTLPLVLNIVVAAIATPHLSFIDGSYVDVPTNADGSLLHPDKATLQPYVLIDETSWAYPLYRFSQPLLIATVIMLVFVISGLFALLAIGVSLFTQRRYIELLIPFVVNLLWWMLPTFTAGLVPDQWSYIIFLSVYLPSGPPLVLQNYVGMGITIFGLACLVASLGLSERIRDVL